MGWTAMRCEYYAWVCLHYTSAWRPFVTHLGTWNHVCRTRKDIICSKCFFVCYWEETLNWICENKTKWSIIQTDGGSIQKDEFNVTLKEIEWSKTLHGWKCYFENQCSDSIAVSTFATMTFTKWHQSKVGKTCSGRTHFTFQVWTSTIFYFYNMYKWLWPNYLGSGSWQKCGHHIFVLNMRMDIKR